MKICFLNFGISKCKSIRENIFLLRNTNSMYETHLLYSLITLDAFNADSKILFLSVLIKKEILMVTAE